MLRLVTYYTPSHEAMCKRFVLSRASGFDAVRAVSYGQTCPTGEFHAEGWNDCMLDKLQTLMSLPEDGSLTLYVDADVCLFPDLAEWCLLAGEELSDDTVAFSDDIIQWCAGIMLFRSTPRVQSFWRTLADLSLAWDLPDQEAIHHLRMQSASRPKGRLPITPCLLPRDMFCNWATVNDPSLPGAWDGESFVVPPSCLAWHANWTIGLANKQRMLERVVLGETSQPAS